jgi:hypothetical protein|tara:strand:- start:2041 stop:2172 length:132 start_codon:yes stop_codon:yes gene_type:complete
MSDKQKKIAWVAATVIVVGFLGDHFGFWEMTAWINPAGGPDSR